MAITGAERRALTGALLLALAACIRSEVQVPAAPPSAPGGGGVEPSLRIGLVVGAASIDIGGSAGVTVTGPDRALVARLGPGIVGKVDAATGQGAGVRRRAPVSRAEAATLVIRAEPGGFIRVNGRDYRGEIVLFRDRTGVTGDQPRSASRTTWPAS